MAETVGSNTNPGQDLTSMFGLPPPVFEKSEVPVLKSAGTSTTAGTINQSTIEKAQKGDASVNSSETINPANPKPATPNASLADIKSSEVSASINLWIGGAANYQVALQEAMAEYFKNCSRYERLCSEFSVNTSALERDMTERLAQIQRDIGTMEAMGHLISAFCAGVGAGISAATGLGLAFKGPRTSTGAVINSASQSLTAIAGRDGVAEGIGKAVVAVKSADLKAQETMLQYFIKSMSEIANRMDKDRNDMADSKNQAMQQYTQMMSAIAQMAKA